MSATTRLLDKYKELRSHPSDNAAAIALGIHRATVSGWRQRGTQAEPHVIAQMAKDVGDDAGGWLALVESERARSDADRKAWAAVARRLGAAAMIACVLITYTPAAPASTFDHTPATLNAEANMHYAKLRRWLGRAARALQRLLSRLRWEGFHAAPALLA